MVILHPAASGFPHGLGYLERTTARKMSSGLACVCHLVQVSYQSPIPWSPGILTACPDVPSHGRCSNAFTPMQSQKQPGQQEGSLSEQRRSPDVHDRPARSNTISNLTGTSSTWEYTGLCRQSTIAIQRTLIVGFFLANSRWPSLVFLMILLPSRCFAPAAVTWTE